MTTIEQEDLAESFFAAPTLGDDPLWYKDAVIYEVHVRAFRDSNADGVGDFRGLTEKLDYLRDLGVTAIWLTPWYDNYVVILSGTLVVGIGLVYMLIAKPFGNSDAPAGDAVPVTALGRVRRNADRGV